MEARESCDTAKIVENVAHLMEEQHEVVMAYKGRLVGRGLGKVSNDDSLWIDPRAIVSLIAAN